MRISDDVPVIEITMTEFRMIRDVLMGDYPREGTEDAKRLDEITDQMDMQAAEAQVVIVAKG